MYDFAFDTKNLRRVLYNQDLREVPFLQIPQTINSLIQNATLTAKNGFTRLELKSSVVRGKTLFQFKNLNDEIVIRKLGKNISKLTRVKQSDRDTIIKSIKTLLSDGHKYRVYRLDISNFYEAILRNQITEKLVKDSGFPPTSLFVWKNFDQQLSALGISGMPRGLSISAVASEYLMREFDSAIGRMPNVYYYARYVDDIFILTTAEEDEKEFRKELKCLLPNGLSFNYTKSKTYLFIDKDKKDKNPDKEHSFDFLGYEFSIFHINKEKTRTVQLDISKRKVKKIKSRIILSLLRYTRDNDFNALIERIKLLSGNYNIYDYKRKIKRNIGLYYNYRFIDSDLSTSLKDLDKFIGKIILSKKGYLSINSRRLLNRMQCDSLISFNFSHSFNKRIFYNINASKLQDLAKCWQYA